MSTPPTSRRPPVPLTYWPGPRTTGVPATARLTCSGPLEVRRDEQTISDLNIIGNITVYASDVTIRGCRITAAGPSAAIRALAPAANLVVEDVEIDGFGSTGAAVSGSDYVLRRMNIHDVVAGPRLGSNCTVADCWIHDLRKLPDYHGYALRAGGGAQLTVRHNRLDAYRADLGDPMNGCLMIGSTVEPSIAHLLVEDNYCDGGYYAIGVHPGLVPSDIVIRNNRFTRNYGYAVIARARQAGITWHADNVWFDDGRPVLH